jgi:protein-disulfide isomerase
VRYVFRHFPLTQAHPHALSAALAAEAAAAQRAFWLMHEALFENQTSLEYDDLLGYAELFDLDVDAFDRDIQTQKYLPKIRGDVRSGLRSGVNAAPTFFVNGARFESRWDGGGLTLALEQAAAASRGLHR